MADSNGSGVGIANRDALITTDEALQHLSDAGYRFVEVDVDTTAYEKGHLPGAFGWNWKRDLQEQPVRDLASKEKLERLLSETGITPDTTVVLYGDNNNWFAAYAYWTLKYYGHDKVQLIDGGRVKWEKEGRPYTTDAPAVSQTKYEFKGDTNEKIRAYRDQVKDKIGKAALVDVR